MPILILFLKQVIAIKNNNQKGAIPLILLVAVIGLVIFILISSSTEFRNRLFSQLFPKGKPFAVSEPISGPISGPITPTPTLSPTPSPTLTTPAGGLGPTPTPTPTPTPQIRLGDGNRDGYIDLNDLSILLSDFNKTSGFRVEIDLNQDGKINTFDFSLLRNLLVDEGVLPE